jgi:hypothetical protein
MSFISDDGRSRTCPICGRDRVCSYEEALTVYRAGDPTREQLESYLRSGKDPIAVCTWCLAVAFADGFRNPSRAYYRGDGASKWGAWTEDARDGGYGDLERYTSRHGRE